MNHQTIPEIVEYNAWTFPDEEAVIFEDSRATFVQLKKSVDHRANALLQIGVTPGDHVAVLSVNSMESLETILAIWSIGAVTVLINWRLSPEELIYVINHCQATFLIFQEQFFQPIEQMMPSLASIRKYLVFERSSISGVIDFLTALQETQDQPLSNRVKGSQNATILYTSGTTGKPKGVVASHENWIAACEAYYDTNRSFWVDHPKSLYSGPFFHSGCKKKR